MQEADKKTRRQSELLAHLQQHHFISLDDISSRFAVTSQTARRDLIDLEEAGRVVRRHGGATLVVQPIDPITYRRRRIENAASKARIGRRVAELVGDSSAVFIDTGTTCEAVAAELTARENLRVVTYSLRSATVLSEVESASVAVPGGFVRHVDAGVLNHGTAEFVHSFRFDFAIISVSGIDVHGEMGDDDPGEVLAVRAAMQRAERTILAVDNSKFGRRALVCLGSIADIDILVTDAPPPAAIRKMLEVKGVMIELT